jgi:thiamine pyrophosphate-dependent acetolactate synthase large subunit-like protein
MDTREPGKGSSARSIADEPTQRLTITGARALVDALLREGVDHVFGIPGTQNLAVIDALRETPKIRFIHTRHEQGAAFMAYGFARASGRPAVVTATEGPGLTNLVTAIAGAYRGFVPVVSICGVQVSELREREASQDMDQVPFMRPMPSVPSSPSGAGS